MTEKLHLTGDLRRDADLALQPYLHEVERIVKDPEDRRGWETRSQLPDDMEHPAYAELKSRTEKDKEEAEKRARENLDRMYEAYDNWR